MKFWKRQATLQIGSKRFGMDDLYFKFTVPFEDSEKLGTATIEAYNLSPATRNSIKKGMPIILNAGYEGDIGAIFTGKVSQVSDKHSGTEVITTIAAAEALEEWLSKEVNKTYTAGSKASAIVKDLLNIFGLEVGTMELAVDKEYPRGKVCKGKVKNVLTEIVTSDCKSRFLIRNGIVTINDPKTGTKTGYVLSAESGLLQAAEATDRTETTTRQTTVKDDGLLDGADQCLVLAAFRPEDLLFHHRHIDHMEVVVVDLPAQCFGHGVVDLIRVHDCREDILLTTHDLNGCFVGIRIELLGELVAAVVVEVG